MARILVTCLGSLGDLYPYLAVGRGLQERGHSVRVATSGIHESRVRTAGLGFVPLRSALDQYLTAQDASDFIEEIFEPRSGAQRLIREIMSGFDLTCADTLAAVADCDLALSHPLTYATPIACRKLDKPWLSTVLAPMGFMSSFDPPFLSAAPVLQTLHRISPALFRGTMVLAKFGSRLMVRPVYRQCRQLGIAAPPDNPLFDGQFSPHGTLAMFPEHFAAPQPDWPPHTTTTGFTFYREGNTDAPAQARLEAFLAAGAAPLVFALGSSVVEIVREFFPVAARVARQLQQRAVLVAGSRATQLATLATDPSLLVLDYVDYDVLFPRASLIVHQGGIGTTAQAARSGRPMLIVPFGFDQFDNAKHMVRLGAARRLPREDFTEERVAPLIAGMLGDTALARGATAAAKRLAAQDGVASACTVIEACISRRAALAPGGDLSDL